ncbi:MAG: disulfide bond formation protein [Deltaproteobacteria bacterium]|nr:disulfide bond formation protein [Deltaproteobacteria bacterium]MBP2685646.1 disulfide bond formation protein [Deltaproteobacteria bacterium]MBS1243502.1 disulfide bond formation protein [Deltaproteobacteria bacterium]
MVKHLPYRYRDYSRMAAEASLAARDQGKFREMHLLLLDRSPKLDRESLIDCAKELKLDVPRFTKDLDTMRHNAEIDRDLKLGEALDLYNTPTIFINGVKLLGDRPFEAYKAVIDTELKAAGTGGKNR